MSVPHTTEAAQVAARQYTRDPGVWNVLVFPCGSEVALELHRSLRYATQVELIGASSVPDHGGFRYARYVEGLPFVDHPDLIDQLAGVVREHRVDAIFPAMDSVVTRLKSLEQDLGCRVIASPVETAWICGSKSRTYAHLQGRVRVPRAYVSIDDVDRFPVFLKPDVGYGSRGARRADSHDAAAAHLRERPDCIVLEYLPGTEFTVDCFTDRFGELRFVGPRERRRVTNGISTNTLTVEDRAREFHALAERVNDALELRGGWFFQAKRAGDGQLVLLEVASRIAGSSALSRSRGVNLALLSVFDAFDLDVEVTPNGYAVEMDRALTNVYRIACEYDAVYVDFDDCLVIRGKVNTELVAFLYQAINEGKAVHLLTRHRHDIHATLEPLRLATLFDSITHLQNNEEKADYIDAGQPIFIDDSFSERQRVRRKLGIPVFAPDMVESLWKP